MPLFKTLTLASAVATTVAGSAAVHASSVEEDIKSLKQQVSALEAQLDMAASAIESSQAPLSKTKLGGYGELHYNSLTNQGSDDTSAKIDFHRFVLFIGHEFSDNISMFSEFELEHALAGDGKPGEVELEQAYIYFQNDNGINVKVGQFLVPVGLLNETHEPPTFYGSERNNVEKYIIPTTWWEAGVAVDTMLSDDVALEVALHSGLDLNDSGASYAIRSGRQKVASAPGDNLAVTGRLKWTINEHVAWATTLQYQSDIGQGSGDLADATLIESNVTVSAGRFGLRALVASWQVNGDGPEAIGADQQSGAYIEPSFKLNDQYSLFARYSQWDNLAGSDADTEMQQADFGLNYYPHPQVVLKADYQHQTAASDSKENNGINLAMGYYF